MLLSSTPSAAALDARARRAARSAGYIARKSRWRKDSLDNFGEYMLIDPHTNIPTAGFTFDMTAEEVIEWCKADSEP